MSLLQEKYLETLELIAERDEELGELRYAAAGKLKTLSGMVIKDRDTTDNYDRYANRLSYCDSIKSLLA